MLKDLLPQIRRRSRLRERPTNLLDLMEDLGKWPLSAFDRFPFEAEDFPPLDICEDEKEITIKAELPGLKPEDIDVTINQGRLTIKGEKKFEDEEKRDNYHRIERSYGSFQRSVSLPSNVETTQINAKFKNGILNLVIPKNETSESTKVKIES
ncbi:Hsp20/alpha crystallin family protein [Maridesulfovibrio ferrireducens]|uniref:Hsp20/alpha crystallin family protein n=1 Tax=Maridesulfovibrio ferrireducens TaxID=246191 RepID=UPI001A22C377|nr:Hsp20/alpha crystallin family protein [Maridesulfovibrio ferrireducens]MBI9110692.1 Hsp20/alpha crystallin family protein [Maridesulfovibrio ferrireducens]